MPVYSDDDGIMVIEPKGDILFCTGTPLNSEDNFIELLIAKPGKFFGVGALAPEMFSKTTNEVGTLVRLRMTLPVCTVMLERIVAIQVELMGMPPMSTPPTEMAVAEISS